MPYTAVKHPNQWDPMAFKPKHIGPIYILQHHRVDQILYKNRLRRDPKYMKSSLIHHSYQTVEANSKVNRTIRKLFQRQIRS